MLACVNEINMTNSDGALTNSQTYRLYKTTRYSTISTAPDTLLQKITALATVNQEITNRLKQSKENTTMGHKYEGIFSAGYNQKRSYYSNIPPLGFQLREYTKQANTL
jgi:hypothetical protein